MSDIQLFLLEYEKSKKEASQIALQSADKLQRKELKLLDLIQSLGDYLNNDEPTTRSRTLAYLAEVLDALPPKTLSGQQRNLLCDFILSRIRDDSEGIGPCARALLALEERGQWDNARVVEVVSTLLEATSPLRQYRLQSDRYAVVQLVDRILAKYREPVKQLHDASPDFLSRLIAYFDGEKDPRNLMIVFSILKVPMSEWNLGNDTQDLFDAVFNYFPITFRPPPDDPYGITAQDLKDRLRDCISSTSAFAPQAFPALLDRLDSTSINTKRDCLQALQGCIVEYDASTISNYSVTLWDALKFEILNVQEEDLAQSALSCFAAMASRLSLQSPKQLNEFLRPIFKECNEHLEDAPTKQSQASGRILESMASANATASNSVVTNVVPHLLTLYHTADNVAKRKGLLEVLSNFITANVAVFGQWRLIAVTTDADSQPPGNQTNALSEHSEAIYQILVNGLAATPISEVSFRLAMLKALLQLTKVRSLLNIEQITSVVGVLSNIVIAEESYGKDETKKAAMAGLLTVAHQKPDTVIEKAFPLFLAHLPDTDTASDEKYLPVLEAFAKLAEESSVFPTIIVRLRHKLKAAVHQQASAQYLAALLMAMLFAFRSRELDMSPDAAKLYFTDLVLPLLQECTARPARETPLSDEVVLDLIGRISNTIIRNLTSEQQSSVTPEVYEVFRGEVLTNHNTHGSKFFILNTHVMASLRKDVALPSDASTPLLFSVDILRDQTISARVRASALTLITLLINKFIPNANMSQELEPIFQGSRHLLFPSNLTTDSVRVLFAILQGLILRNSPLLSKLLPALLDLLANSKYGLTTARGFPTLLAPSDILTKENHCAVSGLHKQKTFNLLVPQLSAAYRSAAPELKDNYLIALSGLLQHIPYTIIASDLPAVTPLLLQSLALSPSESSVKQSAISTLTLILTHDPSAVEEHANTLISRLLSATGKDGDSAVVREASLRCLTIVPDKVKEGVLLPLRRSVVKRLTATLDDPKRVVRGEAVRCRRRWLGFGEGEEDEEEE